MVLKDKRGYSWSSDCQGMQMGSKIFYDFASHSELIESQELIWFVPKFPPSSLCLHLLSSLLTIPGSLNAPTTLLPQGIVSYCCYACKLILPDFEMSCILTFSRLCSNATWSERTSLIILCKIVFNLPHLLSWSYQYLAYNTFICLISVLSH